MKELYINGIVDTVDNGKKEAFIVEDGKFAFVGESQSIDIEDDKFDVVIDLKGKYVLPGFNDSHMHLISTGNSLNWADLYEVKSIDDIVEVGKKYIENNDFAKDHYIMGYGWNQDKFYQNQFPNRYDLDKISTEYPICFIRVCYHIMVVNSKALEMLGLSERAVEVEGGVIDIDDSGVPTGVFRENACNIVFYNITPLNDEEVKKAITDGIEYCNSKGVTSIGTDDLSEFPQKSYGHIIKAFKELEENHGLNARINQQCRFPSIEDYKNFLNEGYKTGVGNLFKIGPLKLIEDGALGGRGALLSEAYSDDEANFGIEVISPQLIEEWVSVAKAHNMQVAIHGIGDKAILNILDAYDKVIGDIKDEDHRYGVVHAQVTNENILNRMVDLNVICYIQTIFLDYDSTIAEKRLGEMRAGESYAFKTMMDLGLKISNGSDSPVEWPDVLKGIQNAITRGPVNDGETVLNEGEALTLDEAIYTFTAAGAYSTFEEKVKGSISEGKLADFVIFEKDLHDVEASELASVSPIATFLGGKRVYGMI